MRDLDRESLRSLTERREGTHTFGAVRLGGAGNSCGLESTPMPLHQVHEVEIQADGGFPDFGPKPSPKGIPQSLSPGRWLHHPPQVWRSRTGVARGRSSDARSESTAPMSALTVSQTTHVKRRRAACENCRTRKIKVSARGKGVVGPAYG